MCVCRKRTQNIYELPKNVDPCADKRCDAFAAAAGAAHKSAGGAGGEQEAAAIEGAYEAGRGHSLLLHNL